MRFEMLWIVDEPAIEIAGFRIDLRTYCTVLDNLINDLGKASDKNRC